MHWPKIPPRARGSSKEVMRGRTSDGFSLSKTHFHPAGCADKPVQERRVHQLGAAWRRREYWQGRRTANAGIPGTGLSYRQRLGGKGKGGVLGILAVVGGLGFWAFQHADKIEKGMTPVTSPVAPGPAATTPAPQPAAVRYVHREGSILRDEPKTSSHILKKESKNAQVMLLSESEGWAKVTDGNITGYMRSSVLGVDPPP